MRSYEDHEWVSPLAKKPALLEFYRGVDIVGWYNTIGGQIETFINEQDEAGNREYRNKLDAFKRIWDSNSPTGAINIEQINRLSDAATLLSKDEWNYANYFRLLSGNLSKIIASEQQLDRTVADTADAGGGGGAFHGGGEPDADTPPPSAYGPDEEAAAAADPAAEVDVDIDAGADAGADPGDTGDLEADIEKALS